MSGKLKDTRVGGFLKRKAPDLLHILGEFVPDGGLLDFVANRIEGGGYIESAEDRQEFRRLIAEERASTRQEVSRRWEADAKSDSRLAKLVRPICLLATLAGFFVVLILDSIEGIPFSVDPSLSEVLEMVALTVFGAYFTGRSIEKSVRK